MATGKRYYWIKLKEAFMSSDTVDFLMGQPNGANYVVLYQMLCLKTINTGGKLSRQIGEIIIPYDVEKIQRDCKWFSADTIRVALNLYKSLGLVYEDQDGVLVLADHQNLVGSETNWKEQKAAQRSKKLPKLAECRRVNANTLLLPTGKRQYVDEKRYGGNGMLAFDLAGGKCEMCGSYDDLLIHHANGYSNEPQDLYVLCKSCHGIAHSPSTDADWLHHSWVNDGQGGGQGGGHVHPDNRDKILDIRDKDNRDLEDKSTDTTPQAEDEPTACPYVKIKELYHSICVSFPRIRAIDGNRKKAVSARWRACKSLDTFKELFMLAESSPFLKGRNDRNWTADFDWMMKATNFSKILEKKYVDKNAPVSGALGTLARLYEEAGADD